MRPIPSAPEFHDRAFVASLKPEPIQDSHRKPSEFHDRAVVASLKRLPDLVEWRAAALIPRPRGRGLIEARWCSTNWTRPPKFHDRAVVASLKQVHLHAVAIEK